MDKSTGDYIPKMVSICDDPFCKKEFIYTPDDILPDPLYSYVFRCNRFGVRCPYCNTPSIVFPHDPTLGKGDPELEKKYIMQQKALGKYHPETTSNPKGLLEGIIRVFRRY